MTDRKLQITMRGLVGLVIIVGFVLVVGYMVTETPQLDPNTAALIGTLLGYLSSKADSIVMYYFGDSEGADKQANTFKEIYQETLHAMPPEKPVPAKDKPPSGTESAITTKKSL